MDLFSSNRFLDTTKTTEISSRIHFWGLEGPEMAKNVLKQRFSIKTRFSWRSAPVRILSIYRRPGLGPGPRPFLYSFNSYSFIKSIFVEVGPSQNTWNLSQARPWAGPRAFLTGLRAFIIRYIWIQGTTYLPVMLAVWNILFWLFCFKVSNQPSPRYPPTYHLWPYP